MRPTGVNDLQVSWAIRDIPSSLLSFEHRSLLFWFLSVLGNFENCYYSLDQISSKIGKSKRWLTAHLKHLEDSKFLFIKRPVKQGRGMANVYTLNYSLILQFLNKDAKSSSFPVDNLKKDANPASFNEERVQKTSEKGAGFATQDINKDIHKRKERARQTSVAPTTIFFEPDIESKNYAISLGVDIDKELTSFRDKFKGTQTQMAFRGWLDKAFDYMKHNRQRSVENEPRCTVPWWGPGHPGWESVHGGKKDAVCATGKTEISGSNAGSNGVRKVEGYLF